MWRDRVSYTGYAEKDVPVSVAEALSRTHEMRIPTAIKVVVNRPYQPIESYIYDQPISKTV